MKNRYCFWAAVLAVSPLLLTAQTLDVANFYQQKDHQAIALEGNSVLLAAEQAGVARRQTSGGSPLGTYSTDDGLADNQVNSLLVDQQGRQWFATDRGLSELSNGAWTTHFSGIKVRSVAQAPDGAIWCAADRVYARMPGASDWTAFPLSFTAAGATLKEGDPLRIRTATDGTVYVGNSLGLAIRYPDSSAFTTYATFFVDDVYLERYPVVDIARDTEGHLWVIKSGGVQLFENGQFIPVNGVVNNLPNIRYNCLRAGASGKVYLGGMQGLCVYNGTATLDLYLYQQGFREIFDITEETPDGRIFFSHETGFSNFDGTHFSHHQEETDVLASENIRQIQRDQHGGIWILGDVLTEFDDDLWTAHRAFDNSDLLRFLRDVVFEPDGHRNFLLDDRLIRQKDNISLVITQPDTLHSPAFQHQIEWDPVRQRTIGVSNFRDGLFWQMEDDQWQTLNFEPGSALCGAFEQSCNNNNSLEGFYISPLGAYFWMDKFRLDYALSDTVSASPEWRCIDIGPECPASYTDCQCNRFRCVAFGQDGWAWMGTDAGLFTAKFVPGGAPVTFLWNTANSVLPNDTILSIALDGEGRLWVGTRGGLAIFTGSNQWAFTQANTGLAGNAITSILHEQGNRTWIGTETGLSRVSLYTSLTPGPAPDQKITVAPNPAGPWTQISLPEPTAVSGYHLWDMHGRNCTSLVILRQESEKVWNLETTQLAPGMYLIELLSPEGSRFGKLVKQ